ncbi:MAG: hypothetical protein LAN18_16170 [Acidobacteriia bacterium]|nr:hypothetical protein [Terriglobia bacterium]
MPRALDPAHRQSKKKRFVKNTAYTRTLFMANILWRSLSIEGQHLQLPLNTIDNIEFDLL